MNGDAIPPSTLTRRCFATNGIKLLGAGLVFPLLPACVRAEATPSRKGERPLPQFTHKLDADWVNSEPLSTKSLKGSVVLVDVWTFGCWNCYRSFPWLNAIEHDYADKGLRVVGIHAPEFDSEKARERVVAKVKEFKLRHPIMIDNDHSYWRALGNSYWPSFYLVDKRGNVRWTFVGETHEGDERARRIAQELDSLLAES